MGDQNAKSNDPPMKLYISMSGPKIEDKRMSVSDFIEIARKTQTAIQQIAQVLYGKKKSSAKGRKKKEIEQYCELFLVGWEKGSAKAVFELAPQPSQMEMFGRIGEESLTSFLEGMEKISSGKITIKDLPDGFDIGVVQTVQSIGVVLGHGIDRINYYSKNGGKTAKVSYDHKFKESIENLISRPEIPGLVTRTGRLEVLNGHNGLSGRLYEPGGGTCICNFRKDQLEILSAAWLHNVKIAGQAIEGFTTCTIEVVSLSVLDEEIADIEDMQGIPFWKSIPTEDLIESQNVSPIANLEELTSLWPADDDPMVFLNYILSDRRKRAKAELNLGAE